MFDAFDLFIVDVEESDSHLPLTQRLIFIALLIKGVTNAFVTNGLARSIDRAIGKELRNLMLGSSFTVEVRMNHVD